MCRWRTVSIQCASCSPICCWRREKQRRRCASSRRHSRKILIDTEDSTEQLVRPRRLATGRRRRTISQSWWRCPRTLTSCGRSSHARWRFWRRTETGRFNMLMGSKTLRSSFVAFTLLLAVGAPLFSQAQQPQLGSLDGEGLSSTDVDRVRVGQVAPDFRLVDERGTIYQLSQYRGKKNIVLVVYRGYW